jgi:hypothetical protein
VGTKKKRRKAENYFPRILKNPIENNKRSPEFPRIVFIPVKMSLILFVKKNRINNEQQEKKTHRCGIGKCFPHKAPKLPAAIAEEAE